MPTLAQLIASQFRTPSAKVYLDGRRWYGVRAISKTQSYGRGPAAFTIEGVDPPVTPVGGMTIRWTWGYTGVEIPGGTGYIVEPEQVSYPRGWSLSCQDVLWLANRETRAIATVPLNTITAQAAIQYILETYAGITRHDIPDIQAPGGGGSWTLGQLTPVSWDQTTPLNAIQDIAGTAGYWVYADAGGTVRAVQMERRPSDSPFRTLRRGDASDGGALLVEGAPRRRKPVDQVKNRIVVRGASTGVEGAQLYDIYLATHVLVPGLENTLEYQSDLLEYEADVTAVAERLAGLWNREPNIVTARIKADPRLNVGMTLGIQDTGIGYSTGQNFFVYQLDTSLDLRTGKFDQTVTLDGGTGDSGYSLVPPPVAVATYTIELETADSTAIAVVRVDGSGSYSQSEGEIVSYAWSTTGVVSGTPTTASTAQATFLYPVASSPVSIDLTVTDTTSKTGTTTLTIDLAAPDVPADVESLNVAFGSAWKATGDGGATWNSYVATTTRVPPIGAGSWGTAPTGDADTYGILASGGAVLRQSLDALASTPTTLNTASGTITALATNAKNAQRVWRAVGPLVQRSIDGGTTWTNWGTPLSGVDVVDILEDPALDNSVFALAGADLWHSLGDGAPGWGVLYAGPSGATARWLQRSEDGTVTWICYTGTFTGAPLHRVEGPVTVTPGTATEIRAIALLDAVDAVAPLLVAFDQDANIYHIDGLTGAVLATSTATFPAGSIVQHAAPSQKLPLVYTADFDSVVSGTGAVRKYFPEAQTLLLSKAGDTGQQAHMVGLTGIGRATAAIILQLPWGASGGGDFIWKYDPTTGLWTGITPPQAGWYWSGLVASPFNPDEWLLVGNTTEDNKMDVVSGVVKARGTTASPLYHTNDGGATWTAVTLTHPVISGSASAGALSAAYVYRSGLGWNEGPAGWIAVGASDGGSSIGGRRWYWLGSGATASVTSTTIENTFGAMAIGQSGEASHITDAPAAVYVHADGTSTNLGSVGAYPASLMDREPSSRRVAWTKSGVLYVLSDYRSGSVTSAGSSLGNDVAWATHGLYVGRTTPISRVDPSTGATTQISTGGGPTGVMRVDRQTRSIVAYRLTDSSPGLGSTPSLIGLYDGTTLRTIAAPPAGTAVTNAIEVIVKTT